ncbi:N-methyl-L-tryptophan oxidase [Klebsiella pneumoniae]|uniref:N-methyl-L-tryptophan oxidase n=1 Tax=Klebsiella pneumoniae TaxID=573 RepID=A0A927DK30_KLEPN|nr:N-methyl-L-tryptophan oxidase [Klebsiella pneumoniae]
MPINLPTEEGSHHGSSRLIRHAYGEGEKYVPLVLRAQQLWDELAEISGEAVFERTGVINLGPASSAFLANVAASARAFQLEVEELDAQAVMQRWPEIRLPDDYRAIFEPASGVLRSELAVETWIRLAREAGCAQLFNCPVSAIHHHADGITIDTLDGEYHGKNCWSAPALGHPPASGPPYPAGTQGVRLGTEADGRYSSKNHFPAFTGELPNGDQYYGFPAEDNELKIGKHNGGQPISTPQERVAFGAVASDGSESFPFLRNVLPRHRRLPARRLLYLRQYRR